MFVNPTDHIQQYIFRDKFYDKPTVLVMEKFINPESIVMDIGANTGYYTLIAANKATKGMVYSFEPVSFHYSQLTENINLNKLCNVTTQNKAISNQKGQNTIYLSSTENSGMSGLKPAENFSGKTELVNTISLDEFVSLNNIGQIDLIKIDIEGAELNALQGMENCIKRFLPVFFIEIIKAQLILYGHSISDVFNWMQEKGYTAYDIKKDCIISKLTVPKEGYAILFLPPAYPLPHGISIT